CCLEWVMTQGRRHVEIKVRMVGLVHAPQQADPMRCTMQSVIEEVEAEDRGSDAKRGPVDALGEAEVNIGQRHEGGDERRHKIAEAEGQAEERKVCEPTMRRRGRNGAP